MWGSDRRSSNGWGRVELVVGWLFGSDPISADSFLLFLFLLFLLFLGLGGGGGGHEHARRFVCFPPLHLTCPRHHLRTHSPQISDVDGEGEIGADSEVARVEEVLLLLLLRQSFGLAATVEILLIIVFSVCCNCE